MDDLIEHLNRGGAYAYYWLKEPDGSSKTIWYPVGQMPDIPPDATNVYFGVNPCKAIPQAKRKDGTPIPPEFQRATLDNLAAINCLFAEFDAKDYGDKDKILRHLDNLSIHPNVIVDSGGGYHCYWILFSPMKIIDHATLEYFQSIQARWVLHVGGDKGAKDLCRVLRVPGTYNYKYDPPEEVIIINQDMHYYELPDLIAILPPEPEKQEAPETNHPVLAGNSKTWIDRALSRRVPGMSNEVGFWLAAQLRDDGISVSEAESAMLAYARGVRIAGSKSGYTDKEALDSLRSAYRSSKREPAKNLSKPVTISGAGKAAKSQPEKRNGNGHHPAGESIENYLPDESQWPDDQEVTDQVAEPPAESQGPTSSEQAIVTASPSDEAMQDLTVKNFDASAGDYQPFERVKRALDENEDGDARLLADLFRGRILFDHSDKTWYMWNKHYWERDRVGKMYRLVSSRLAPQYLHAAADAQRAEREKLAETLTSRAYMLRTKKRMENIMNLCAMQSGIGITGEEWDSDPWLLGCPNGVIDLHTGKLRDGKPSDYIRAHTTTAYNPLAKCEQWQSFLSAVYCSDEKVIGYVRRLFGYAITGLSKERIMPVFVGEGANGKGTMLETLGNVLGDDISLSTDSEALMDIQRPGSGAQPFIYDLRGKRMVWASESPEGKRLNTTLVKKLTGGDRLNVRKLHSNPVQFKPTHTIFLLTNHKPHVSANDQAIWDRMRLIHFTQRWVQNPQAENEHKEDPFMIEKLTSEREGILAWLVRGCLEWQEIGLSTPDSISNATKEYREEEDTLGLYMGERCIIKTGLEVKSSALYSDYVDWCKESNMSAMSVTAFGTRIKKRFPAVHKEQGNYYTGIGLNY